MTDVIERFHYDDATDTATITQHQDIEPFIEANKRAMTESSGMHKSETFNHVAKIPEVVALKWCRDKGINYQEFLANPKVLTAFLNDPDMGFCRTMKSKI